MSRGPGRVQRAMLQWLTEQARTPFGRSHPDMLWSHRTVTEAVGGILGVPPSYVLHESVRRAARRLSESGHVRVERRWGELRIGLTPGQEGLSVEYHPTLTTPEEAGRLVEDLAAALAGEGGGR